MDRGLAVNLDTLSREPEGKLEEGLRNTRELVGVAQIGSESLEILLDRVQRGANPPSGSSPPKPCSVFRRWPKKSDPVGWNYTCRRYFSKSACSQSSFIDGLAWSSLFRCF
jgi:hypothetical protein